MIPPLLNDFIGLQKDSALVAVLGVTEGLRQAQIIQASNFNFTPYIALALVYIVITIPQARFVDWLIPARPAASRRQAGGVVRVGAACRRSAIVIEGLHKSFGDLHVLRGVDLEVADHEVVCLIGASGSGKSTLLRCVNLLEPIDAGRIVVEGEEITAIGVDVNAIRRQIGIVFQSFNLFPHMTVLRNITLDRSGSSGTPPSQAEGEARELLDRFGLADKADEYPDRLSGGSSSASRSCERSP